MEAELIPLSRKDLHVGYVLVKDYLTLLLQYELLHLAKIAYVQTNIFALAVQRYFMDYLVDQWSFKRFFSYFSVFSSFISIFSVHQH